MSHTATDLNQVTVDGWNQVQQSTLQGDSLEKINYALNAAFAGSVTTYTDASHGVVTASGHNIITGDKVCVFWRDANGVLKYRSGMDATVSGAAITVAGGDSVSGSSNLPPATTTVTISKLQTLTLPSDPDIATLKLLTASTSPTSLDALVQARSTPAGDSKVNFLCDGSLINNLGGANVNTKSVPSLFTGLSTDTQLGLLHIYPGTALAGTLLAVFMN